MNPLPEVFHQACWDVLESSAIDEINMLCQWCSLASTNLLRSDNLASKLFVTVSFSCLLTIAKWWMNWMVQNKVLAACTKFWAWEVLSEGPVFCRFEPCFFLAHDSRTVRLLMNEFKNKLLQKIYHRKGKSNKYQWYERPPDIWLKISTKIVFISNVLIFQY